MVTAAEQGRFNLEPESKFKVIHDENMGAPHPFIRVESEYGLLSIPVYDVRNKDHHGLIVNSLNSGTMGAFEVGVIGLLKAVGDQRVEKENWKRLLNVKKGRTSGDKFPFMMHPKDHDLVVDFSKLHPDFHFLVDPIAREKFYGKIPFHTVLPFRENNEWLNREAFVTTAEESIRKPGDQQVGISTVCIYFPGGDPIWKDILRRVNPTLALAITSLNDHGEPSPWNYDELLDHTRKKRRVDFRFVIRDEIVANAKISSSHTMIRLPHMEERSEILIMRKGPVSADTISKFTGFPVRILDSAKLATRGHPEGVRLDDRVLEYLQKVKPQTV